MKDEKSFKSTVLRVATEGRKFDTGLCLICEHPSELDEKLLSQCRQITPITIGQYKGKYIVSTMSIFGQIIKG